MQKLLKILYQPYKWLVLVPIIFIDTVIFGTLTIPLALISKKLAHYVSGCFWSRLNGTLTPIFVKVHGRENMKKKQSYVIIANHQSSYDIFVLYGWLWIDFKWVMKKELEKVPGLGWGSKVVGHIFIDRRDRKAALKTMKEAREKVKNGTSVIFFPEGTRSETSEMLPFKKGAFKFAYDLNLPVLPITINGTDKILPSDTWDLMPGRAEIVIHPPIDINEYPEEKIQDLMDRSREVIDSVRVI
ncbi:lysophospholipid acyltransferase family protein [Bacteroidota bacterium]